MKYVLIEGIDGTGKSLLADHIFSKAKNRRLNAHRAFEPSEGPYGRLVREKIEKGDFGSPDELKELFFKDRETHFKRVINPRLNNDGFIVQDRGFVSSAAYQSNTLEDVGKVIMDHAEHSWFRFPDHLILLTCPPAVSIQRVGSRGKKTGLENSKVLTKAQEHYLEAIKFLSMRGLVANITILNTSFLTIDEFVRCAWDAIAHDLPKK